MEVWKKVEGFNNVYSVSSLGRVRSKDQYFKNRRGSGKQTGRILKLQKCKKGYLRVSLSENKKRFTTGAHRLVAKAFIKNPENKPQVNHIDGNKSNNTVSNLEWCTNRENTMHALKNNMIKHNKGEEHHNSKLTNDQVRRIRQRLKCGEMVGTLSKEFKISAAALSNIKLNNTYINI